jgi:hypothetical protein
MYEMKERIKNEVVRRVVEELIDIRKKMKKFNHDVNLNKGKKGREKNLNEREKKIKKLRKREEKKESMVEEGGS